MSDATLSTLAKIKRKVRLITNSQSLNRLSDEELTDYINTFILYDFPENLRMFSLRRTFTFWTKPFLNVYSNNTTNPNDPLYNFKNKYTNVYSPIYCAGLFLQLFQDKAAFYCNYANVQQQLNLNTYGDGVTTSFTGVLPPTAVQTSGSPKSGILQNFVMFSTIDANSNGMTLIDKPTSVTTGNLYSTDDPVTVRGSINYLTGAYVLNFPLAPKNGELINAQVVPYIAGRPLTMLYFNNEFTFWPVPDQAYRIDAVVTARPTELLDDDECPDLAEWWQYIAIGAARKVFEDRSDQDSIDRLMPSFKEQEQLILNRSIAQSSDERSATLFSGGAITGTNIGWNNFLGSNINY